MAEYLQLSLYTLKGIRKVIDLDDFSYEWIVYDGGVPTYLVDLQTENEPDMIIN